MNSDILISVIINCYNGENFLKDCFESINKQTYKNWEVIFWDNQSYDNSKEIFNFYSNDKYKYFYAENHTKLGEARNLAVEKSKGDWIAFLDCDDYWEYDKLEKQVNLFLKIKDPRLSFIYSKIKIINSTNIITDVWQKKITKKSLFNLNNLPNGEIFNDLIFENFIPMSSALIKKSHYIEIGGIDNNLKQVEDYDLFLKLTSKYNAFSLNEELVFYRIHDNNQSIGNSELVFDEIFYILSKYKHNKFYSRAINNYIGLKNINNLKIFKLSSCTKLFTIFIFTYQYFKLRFKNL